MANVVKMKLAELASCSDSHQQLVVRYSQLLAELVDAEEKCAGAGGGDGSSSSCPAAGDELQLQEGLQYFIRHVVNDSVSLVISRQLVAELVRLTGQLPDPVAQALALFTLSTVQSRAISFEEQLASMRQHLSAIYERRECWREAATVLAAIPLEAGRKQYSTDYRLETYVHIARLFLEDADAIAAETYITRASVLQAETKNEKLSVLYRVCYARILDHRRKFVEAAQRYLELSYRPIVHEDERMTALTRAVVCTVLSPAGRPRSRILATLFKDERCQSLPAYALLEKMYLGRVIGAGELAALEPLLLPHQRALASDSGGGSGAGGGGGGSCSLLERAVVEHNIVAASRLYTSVRLAELGALLGVSAQRAEAVAGQMVCEERLEASLDQISGVLQFGGRRRPLAEWHQQLGRLCAQVNTLVERIAAVSPQWLEQVTAQISASSSTTTSTDPDAPAPASASAASDTGGDQAGSGGTADDELAGGADEEQMVTSNVPSLSSDVNPAQPQQQPV